MHESIFFDNYRKSLIRSRLYITLQILQGWGFYREMGVQVSNICRVLLGAKLEVISTFILDKI